MYMLSMHNEGFKVFKKLKIARFAQFGIEKSVLDACESWMPKIPSTIARSISNSSDSKGYPPLRVIIPYNRFIGASVKTLAAEIRDVWSVLLRGIISIDLDTSFRNSGPPLHIALRRIGAE